MVSNIVLVVNTGTDPAILKRRGGPGNVTRTTCTRTGHLDPNLYIANSVMFDKKGGGALTPWTPPWICPG